MKKIFYALILTTSYIFAAICTPKHSDPVVGDMSYTFTKGIEDIKKFIKDYNDQVKDKYNNLNENQIQNILDGFKTKKRLLTNIQNLSREDDILKLNELHETMIKKELDGLLIDTWGTE